MTRAVPLTKPEMSHAPVQRIEDTHTGTTTMRIAYLTSEYPKASHTFIRREILELERRGHSVLRISIRDMKHTLADPIDVEEQKKTFHCLSQPVLAIAWLFIHTVSTRPVRFLHAVTKALRMARASDRSLFHHIAYLVEATVILRKLEHACIQHVHVHFGTNGAAVARLVKTLGGPSYSMMIHGPIEFDAPRAFSLGAKVSDSTFVTAISDFAASQIRRWSPYDTWKKIHVVRCTVSEDFFSSDLPVDESSITLLCIGRLSASKAQLLLLDAVKELVDDGVALKLILAGDGEMREIIESRISELSLESHVEITGWVSGVQIRELLKQSRVLVQPSFAEGLPVVIMEAMAMARPVIATIITGIPELVRHGENGWLILPGNLDQLVQSIRHVLATPANELNEMGRQGQRLVRDRHFVTTEVDKLEQLLLNIKHTRSN